MKVRRIFTVLIILTCLISCLFTCKLFNGEEVEYEYTDVVYTWDGNENFFVTIYLDGQVSVPRSLNAGIAKMGCDYFEVTFLYNNGGSYEVARGEWTAGKMAGVSGVKRTPGGIDYGGVTATPSGDNGSAILFAGKSDKTLMAIGRLTGVDGAGTQTAPETRITTNTKSITFTISAITSGVKATATTGFTEGKATATARDTANSVDSSFLTNAGNTAGAINVSNTNVILNSRVFGTNTTFAFPIFKLNPKDKIEAVYRFALSNAAGNYSIGAYANAIFISTPAFGNVIPGLPPVPPNTVPAEIERKQPRYTTYDSTGNPIDEYHKSVLMLDEKTVVVLTNNNIPETPFDPAVGFTFFTDDTVIGTVFSLVFSIPVYALQEYESYYGGNGIGIKSRWYIRSGYGPSLYDLDDGTSGMGGAVLIGTGEVNKIATGDRTIRIAGKELENGGINGLPNRWQYTASTTSSSNNGTVFDITGLVVQLTGVGANPEVFIDHINYNDLKFKIGKGDTNGRHPNWTSTADAYTQPPSTNTPDPWYRFPPEFYGLIEITVEYYDKERDRFYQTSFYVLVGNAAHPFQSNFNILHIYGNGYTLPNGTSYAFPSGVTAATWQPTSSTTPDITSNVPGERLSLFMETASIRNRTTIIILHHSFNVDRNFIVNATVTDFGNFIVIAADDDRNASGNTVEDIVMGRLNNAATGGNLARITHSGGSNAGQNAWYFGKWPFKGTPDSYTWPYFPYDTTNLATTGGTNYTKEFTVNTAGVAYITGGNPPTVPDASNPTTSWKMLVDNVGTVPGAGIYNAKVNGAKILPTVIQNGVTKYPLLH